jgi:hypothetical protein
MTYGARMTQENEGVIRGRVIKIDQIIKKENF